jgi:SAM-dependent methyltransferase
VNYGEKHSLRPETLGKVNANYYKRKKSAFTMKRGSAWLRGLLGITVNGPLYRKTGQQGTSPAVGFAEFFHELRTHDNRQIVYKPDYAHLPATAAQLSQPDSWTILGEQACTSTSGSHIRMVMRARHMYALLVINQASGKAWITVDGKLRDVVDLCSYGWYVRPVELFNHLRPQDTEVQITLTGPSLACCGFLIDRENANDPEPRVGSAAGFKEVQLAQIDTWLESHKGDDMEEVSRQRQAACTLRVAEALAFVPAGSRLLDIGCGYVFPNILRELILVKSIEYWLHDIDPAVCDANRRLFREQGIPERQVTCGDNTALAYPSGHFGAVFSSHCLEHSANLDATFAQIRRILAPGGTLVYAVPIGWDSSEEHIYAATLEDWISLTQRNGFQVISANIGCYYPEGGGYDLMVVAR